MLFGRISLRIASLLANLVGYAAPVVVPYRTYGYGGYRRGFGIPFLGRVPLDIAIRTASDAGEPPAAGADDRVFAPIAAQVADWLSRN